MKHSRAFWIGFVGVALLGFFAIDFDCLVNGSRPDYTLRNKAPMEMRLRIKAILHGEYAPVDHWYELSISEYNGKTIFRCSLLSSGEKESHIVASYSEELTTDEAKRLGFDNFGTFKGEQKP